MSRRNRPREVLSTEIVRMIRHLRSRGALFSDLAGWFGVHRSTASARRAAQNVETSPMTNELCSRCGLDVAAWRTVVGRAVYCSAFCAGQAPRTTCQQTFICSRCEAWTRSPLADGWRLAEPVLCADCITAAERPTERRTPAARRGRAA